MAYKRLSVIVPGYKTPSHWWKRCILSILNAIGENDEIICIDDGTPEGIPILYELEKKDRRIKIFLKENGGLSSARNMGISKAKGDFITFVDSDDEVCSNIFNECLSSLTSTGADIALYGVKVVWVKEQLSKDDIPPIEIEEQLTPANVKTLSDKCLLNYVCNKIYRRDFLQNNNLMFHLHGMPCEDIIFNLECILAHAKWVMVNQIGYIYYRTEGTLLSQYRPHNADGLYLCRKTWEKYVKTSKEAYKLFFKKVETCDSAIAWAQWDNSWRLNSPYSHFQRLRWLQKNMIELRKLRTGCKTTLLKISPVALMVYQIIYFLLRRYFYFNFIRRWHIKRLYPHVKKIKKG